MDLSTKYLGFDLPNPFITGAGPHADDLDSVRRLEDAGAAAIVMRSLFEEQIVHEREAYEAAVELPAESFSEALTFFANTDRFRFGPDSYLEHLRRVKEAVDLPVIGSLNGASPGGWMRYADLMAEAGADALELNVYFLPTDAEESAAAIEGRTLELVSTLASELSIPLAVKLSPYYTSLANIAKRLEGAGASGLVIFNRFYQPDIDPDELRVDRTLELSTSADLRLRLRWLAVLSSTLEGSLAVTGGVHTVQDAVKAVMAGADAVQVVSTLLQNGLQHLSVLRDGVAGWLEEHRYESLEQARGSMNLAHAPDAMQYERANYAEILLSWK